MLFGNIEIQFSKAEIVQTQSLRRQANSLLGDSENTPAPSRSSASQVQGCWDP